MPDEKKPAAKKDTGPRPKPPAPVKVQKDASSGQFSNRGTSEKKASKPSDSSPKARKKPAK